jgi:hypothetical protein
MSAAPQPVGACSHGLAWQPGPTLWPHGPPVTWSCGGCGCRLTAGEFLIWTELRALRRALLPSQQGDDA